MPSILQQWTERARQQGIQRGRQEGRQEGEAALLERLLERKFGNLPPRYLQRLRTADPATLLRWGERVLAAVSLDEVFED